MYSQIIGGHNVVALILDKVGDGLRSRAGHRVCVLVGQRSGHRLPRENVVHHEAILLGAPCVLGEVDQICLQSVVGPLGSALPRLRGFGASTCLATSPLRASLARFTVTAGWSENSRLAIWYSFQASLTLKSLASRRLSLPLPSASSPKRPPVELFASSCSLANPVPAVFLRTAPYHASSGRPRYGDQSAEALCFVVFNLQQRVQRLVRDLQPSAAGEDAHVGVGAGRGLELRRGNAGGEDRF